LSPHIFAIRYGQDIGSEMRRSARWYPLRANARSRVSGRSSSSSDGADGVCRQPGRRLQFSFLCDLSILDVAVRRGRDGIAEEQLGVTYKTAWRMARRVRRFMAGSTGRRLRIRDHEHASLSGNPIWSDGQSLESACQHVKSW